MALRPRQIKFYVDRCSIYRRNKTKAANGDFTYSLIASNVVCKLFTATNMDGPTYGFTMTNQDSVFTADQLHMDLDQDIAAEDLVMLTSSPNGAFGTWQRVAGDPQGRAGVANRREVYLKADITAPVII